MTKVPTERVSLTKGCLSTSVPHDEPSPGVAFPSSEDNGANPMREEQPPGLFHVEHQERSKVKCNSRRERIMPGMQQTKEVGSLSLSTQRSPPATGLTALFHLLKETESTLRRMITGGKSPKARKGAQPDSGNTTTGARRTGAGTRHKGGRFQRTALLRKEASWLNRERVHP